MIGVEEREIYLQDWVLANAFFSRGREIDSNDAMDGMRTPF